MRRRLNGALDALRRLARPMAREWDGFWYTPADPTLLGAIRILTGLMLLYTHAVWGRALRQFFGPSAWLSPALVRALQADQYTYSFWWWVPPAWIWPAHLLSLLVLGLFTVGLRTRVTSVLALIVATSYVHRVPEATFGLDQINIMLLLYLTIGDSGQALSADRWLAARRLGAAASRPARSVSANLALRLINVHMCVIYFFAGIAKLKGESWWDGTAMWRALANMEYQSLDMTWLASYPRALNLATHASVLWEVSFAFLIWRPRLRSLMLAGAVVLHIGIGACLGMWTFALIMLIGNASFLPGDVVQRGAAALRRPRRAGAAAARPFAAPALAIDRGGRAGALEPALTADGAR